MKHFYSISIVISLLIIIGSGIVPAAEDDCEESGYQASQGLVVHESAVVLSARHTSKYPEFVYRNLRDSFQNVFHGKMGRSNLYFYSHQPETLQVQVEVRRGNMNAWWPQAVLREDQVRSNGLASKKLHSSLQWDVALEPDGIPKYLESVSDAHWFSQLRDLGSSSMYSAEQAEQFLMWEVDGVPLDVSITKYDGLATVVNRSNSHAALDVIVLEGKGDQFSAHIMNTVHPQDIQEIDFDLDDASLSQADVRTWMMQRMIEAGLYPCEAKSLLQLWQKTFFQLEGTRVLYRMHPDAIDELYPLTVNQQPKKMVRVWWVCQEIAQLSVASPIGHLSIGR